MSPWTSADLESQAGRTFVVTGANSGLGRAATVALAGAGGRVVMAVRDVSRGEAVAVQVDGEVEVRRLDLADLSSVREFAQDWTGPIDVLINNAGIMAVPQNQTVDGFELQLGTNHLGHFALTNLLLPAVTDRVVTVSSAAHRIGSINLADLNWRTRRYRPWRAYGQSKLANLLFTLELQRRLQTDGSQVLALAAHPGYAATNLQLGRGSQWADRIASLANTAFGQSPEMGALPIVFAATQDLPGGSYVGPDGLAEHHGYPTLVGRSAAATDLATAEALWAESERLTGTCYPGVSTAR